MTPLFTTLVEVLGVPVQTAPKETLLVKSRQ